MCRGHDVPLTISLASIHCVRLVLHSMSNPRTKVKPSKLNINRSFIFTSPHAYTHSNLSRPTVPQQTRSLVCLHCSLLHTSAGTRSLRYLSVGQIRGPCAINTKPYAAFHLWKGSPSIIITSVSPVSVCLPIELIKSSLHSTYCSTSHPSGRSMSVLRLSNLSSTEFTVCTHYCAVGASRHYSPTVILFCVTRLEEEAMKHFSRRVCGR